MKLLNSLEFKSVTGGECVGYTPAGLIHAFKLTDKGCASWVCSPENKGSSWRNSHWYRPNGYGNCPAPTEDTEIVEEVEEFVEAQKDFGKLEITVVNMGQVSQ